jgi:predicted Zn-dependent protease
MHNRKLSIVCIVLFFISCSTVPITGRRQLSLVPQNQLIALSRDSYRQLIQQSDLSENRKEKQMVVNVGKKIALAAEQFMRENNMKEEIKNYRWEFRLIEDDKMINAFAMPGGKVAVYTGILPIAQDENGLAVVLGHEIAHVLANHGGERMSQLLLVRIGAVALSTALSTQPELSRQLFMSAYGAGTQVGVLLPYSRSHELESDHIGLVLMALAGYDPRVAIPFWERMNSLGGEKPPEFLSTHPGSEKRIEYIQNELPEAMKYYKR